MLGKFSGLLLKNCMEVAEKKKKKSRCFVFTSSTKREVRHFHLVSCACKVTAKKYTKKAGCTCKVVILGPVYMEVGDPR